MALNTNTSLGKFASLPLELREQIWGCISWPSSACSSSLHPQMPTQSTQSGLEFSQVSPQQLQTPVQSIPSRLAFLQASSQINAEASTAAYKNLVLEIFVSPACKHKHWLRVECSYGITWDLESVDEALRRGFDHLPYERLEKIQINIEAPNRRDPGQIVCLHKNCVDLLSLLEHAPHGLPNVEINLIDSTTGKWFLDDNPQASVTSFRKRRWPQLTIGEDDADVALFVFARLRNVRHVTITLPYDMEYREFYTTNLANAMMSPKPLGTNVDESDAWNDDEIQQDWDELWMSLEEEFDVLPGHTADHTNLSDLVRVNSKDLVMSLRRITQQALTCRHWRQDGNGPCNQD